jgi:hypothetical protein
MKAGSIFHPRLAWKEGRKKRRRRRKERKKKRVFVEDEREDSHGDAAADGADTVSGSDEDGASVDTTRNETIRFATAAVPLIYTRWRNWFPSVCMCMYFFCYCIPHPSDAVRDAACEGTKIDTSICLAPPPPLFFLLPTTLSVCLCVSTLWAQPNFNKRRGGILQLYYEMKKKERKKKKKVKERRERNEFFFSFINVLLWSICAPFSYLKSVECRAFVIWLSDAPLNKKYEYTENRKKEERKNSWFPVQDSRFSLTADAINNYRKNEHSH